MPRTGNLQTAEQIRDFGEISTYFIKTNITKRILSVNSSICYISFCHRYPYQCQVPFPNQSAQVLVLFLA